MRDPEEITAARYALGRQLAALRSAAGYNQTDFAPLTGYGRSTVANVEVGRQNVGWDFWERVIPRSRRAARSPMSLMVLKRRYVATIMT